MFYLLMSVSLLLFGRLTPLYGQRLCGALQRVSMSSTEAALGKAHLLLGLIVF